MARLWHDGGMSKRSTRLAKRDEFENAIKAVEEGIRARRCNAAKPAAHGEAAGTEGRDEESGRVESQESEEGK
jgi:hypothetical protein